MYDISLIEACFKKFTKNLAFWIPDGIDFVNLDLLHRFNLLHFQPHLMIHNPSNNRYFHIIESPEKITMINDEFIVWIIPDRTNDRLRIYTLIALNSKEQEPHLEAGFVASGIYNTSNFVLKILEKFLNDIQETEQILSKF